MRLFEVQRARRRRIERAVAALTLVNGGLGLGVGLYSGNGHVALALLGLLAGALAWRGRKSGHLAALAFYGPQLASYYAFDLTRTYNGAGALSLGFVAYIPTGVLVLNVFALAMFAASVALLWQRARAGKGA